MTYYCKICLHDWCTAPSGGGYSGVDLYASGLEMAEPYSGRAR